MGAIAPVNTVPCKVTESTGNCTARLMPASTVMFWFPGGVQVQLSRQPGNNKREKTSVVIEKKSSFISFSLYGLNSNFFIYL